MWRRRRFVVTGDVGGREVVFAGDRDGWHVLDTVPEKQFAMLKLSPSLRYVAISHLDDIGRVVDGRVVRFDGTDVVDLGASLDPVGLTGEGLVAVEYELERVDDAFVRSSRSTLPWMVVDLASGRRTSMGERPPYSEVVPLDGGFVVVEDRCSAFRTASPERAAATFGCDYVLPPLAVDGGRLYRMRADGRDDLGAIPSASGGLAQHVVGGTSTFVSLREEDGTQVVTFAGRDDARVVFDPGDAGGRDFSSLWSRVAGRADLACAVVDRTGCARGWTGTCASDVLDIACSDGRTLRTRRIERSPRDDAEAPSGARELTLTKDARFVLWSDAGVLHAVDTSTFDEMVLDTPSLSVVRREGDLPDVFGRIR